MSIIFKRRSIRKYTDEKVSRDILKQLVKAGMNAPSAMNEQPWAFVIIDDKELLARIPTAHPYATMITKAAAGILVCADMEKVRSEGFWIQDCSAATQNILLTIAEQNLGGVWLGCYPREDRVEGLRELMNLPENLIPFSLISLGYPAKQLPEKNHFDESLIRYNAGE